MSRVRDVANRRERLAFDAAENAKQDAAAKEVRGTRKAELRAHLDRIALYHENTSHLPAQHKRSHAPEIELRAGDETILVELNSELLAEISGPVDPAQVEAENEQAYVGRSKAAAKQFTEEEPLYYKCKENFQIMASYLTEHQLPAESVDSFREAFSKTRAQLKQRPQPSAEDRANEYFTKTVIRSEGKDWTEAELDKLSADRYKQVMRIPQRAPLGSIMSMPQ